MKKRILASVIFFILFSLVKADGLPVDEDGNILTDHVVFYFDSLQREQINYSGYFKLNDEQTAIVRKLNRWFPEKIHFISPFYNDCTCGMTYGIWNKKNSFAIPLYLFEDYEYETDTLSGLPGEIEYEEHSYWESDRFAAAKLFIGADGNLYSDKNMITSEDIIPVLNKISAKEDTVVKSLFVRKPPKVNNEIDGKVNLLLEELKKLAVDRSIDFYTSG